MAEVQLPETVELTLEETGDLLQVLDDAEALAPAGSRVARDIRSNVRLLTRKLWPELGRLLDEDEE